MPLALKKFQLEDYSRLALHKGAIVAHDTGLGKSWAAFLLPFLKLGCEINGTLKPKGSVLIVCPGDLIQQMTDEGLRVFKQRVVHIDCQDTFLKFSSVDGKTGRRILPNGYYITSYQALTQNGVEKAPPIAHNDTGEPVIDTTIGDCKEGIKCVYSPTMADLSWNTFDHLMVDEGVRMKGDDTLIGTGIRQMNPRFRDVLSATPIKNRLPDAFWLAHFATGGYDCAHARFPYDGTVSDKESFSNEFMICEHNLTKESEYRRNTGKSRRFKKLTPQVTSVHKLWKFFAPIILRRRKSNCGEEIVEKVRHVVRVPLGKHQSEVYSYHIHAKYQDKNGKPAIGAQLQALRVVAADPTSSLLHYVNDTVGENAVYKSQYPYTPKVAATLTKVHQLIAAKEQVVVFSALHDALDTLSNYLRQAGVKHVLLDGRTSQKSRGAQSARFKLGPPATAGSRASESIPVMLAGVDSMSEGHSFHLCSNVIMVAYSWAYDKFEQAINRVHRLVSPKPVNVYSVICNGSVDRKLEQLIQEKADAAELVLDGRLVTEASTEVNLAEILNIAQADFANRNDDAVDEIELAKGWDELRCKLEVAGKEWYK